MDIYFDYENNVLKNKPNITDADELANLEYKITAIRATELMQQIPSNKPTMQTYKNIHYHLFQDLYEWAGQYRKINISKGKTNFLSPHFFGNAEREIDKQIKEYLDLINPTKEVICRKLAKIMIDLNYMHPLREGNGRTQREFIRQLAYVKGVNLNISYQNESHMKASICDDENLMYHAFLRDIKQL